MHYKIQISIFFLLVFSCKATSQSFNFGFLFKPGITVGAEYNPEATFADSGSFSYMKYRTQLTIPLKTKLDVSLKKLDISSSQTFFTFNTSVRDSKIGFGNEQFHSNIYTGSVGITLLKAGLRKGIWLYSANLSISESENSIQSNPKLNFLGYLVHIKLGGLKFIHFYGAAAVYNQGKFIPAPILGFNVKLAKKTRWMLILPIQSKITYKISNKNSVDFAVTLSGFNSVVKDKFLTNETEAILNYRHLKTFIGYNQKIGKTFRLITEFGFSSLRTLKFSESLYDNSYKISPTPYIAVSLQIKFNKSLLDNFAEGVD